MKHSGNGQARVLSEIELKAIFENFNSSRDRALFGICLFTGCRISEALNLNTQDIKDDFIVFRKSITKGKLRTRSVTISPQLKKYLSDYIPDRVGVLFPGQRGISKRLTRQRADECLRIVCEKLGLQGVSTHSFRRTALTQMANAGTPLSHIQKVSGHSDLGVLQKYLEVNDSQISLAIARIGF